jgi:V/A-type H+/Na+-transporting ATPase subunit C
VDYGYLNARIRGMKSRLLDRETLERLVLKPDFDSVMTELERTSYREEIDKASVRFSGIARLETALRQDFTKAFRKILSYIRGEDAEMYIRILLNRWDIQNVKTILRGKNIHAPATEILDCLVPAGELDDATLAELVKQPDVKSVIDLMATWRIPFARPLTLSFKEYLDRRDMSVLEYALDKFSFENAIKAVKGETYDDLIMRQIITVEIDVTNVKTVFKLVRDRVPTEEAGQFLLKGGISLDREKLLSMVRAGTLSGAVKLLAGTPFEFLGKVPEEVFAQEKISVLERELDRYMIRKGVAMFFRDPLSIAMAVGYLWAKYNEVTNLRIIARCRLADIPEKELRGELLHV